VGCFRLILEVAHNPMPDQPDGLYLWSYGRMTQINFPPLLSEYSQYRADNTLTQQTHPQPQTVDEIVNRQWNPAPVGRQIHSIDKCNFGSGCRMK